MCEAEAVRISRGGFFILRFGSGCVWNGIVLVVSVGKFVNFPT